MRKMKDCGIEWIGEIPSDWDVKRLKYIVNTLYKGNGITKDEVFLEGNIECVRYGEIYSKYSNSFSECISLTKEEIISSPQYFSYGDILFAGTGELVEEIGKNIVYLGKNKCLAGGDIIIAKHSQNPSFLNYALNSSYCQYQKSKGKAKLKVVHITASQIGNILVFLPPLAEQKKIADFLDEKCGEIDSIRSDIQKQIDILNDYKKSVITEAVTKGLNPKAKLKDSGIEWIGKIPEGWITKKLKYLTNQPLQYGANESGCDYDDSLPRYIRITDISMDNKLKDEGKLSLEYDKAKPYLLEDYDLLFARSGASVGKTFLYKKEYGTSAFAGYLIKASLDKKKVSPKFVYYNTLSCCYESWKQQAFTQATIQNIGAEKYNTFVIPVPPLPEQKAIADYLDEKCSEINATIADKQRQLETLDEYKKSLIFEYVTGKKEVLA